MFSNGLAEFVAFQMLYFSKNSQKWMQDQKDHKWEPAPIKMLQDCTLGIIGYGGIGKECARIVSQGFGTRVIGMKRKPETADSE